MKGIEQKYNERIQVSPNKIDTTSISTIDIKLDPSIKSSKDIIDISCAIRPNIPQSSLITFPEAAVICLKDGKYINGGGNNIIFSDDKNPKTLLRLSNFSILEYLDKDDIDILKSSVQKGVDGSFMLEKLGVGTSTRVSHIQALKFIKKYPNAPISNVFDIYTVLLSINEINKLRGLTDTSFTIPNVIDCMEKILEGGKHRNFVPIGYYEQFIDRNNVRIATLVRIEKLLEIKREDLQNMNIEFLNNYKELIDESKRFLKEKGWTLHDSNGINHWLLREITDSYVTLGEKQLKSLQFDGKYYQPVAIDLDFWSWQE